MEAYQWGQRDFGENKVQELAGKSALLPVDIRWHFIGHLQTNKVKYIVPFVYMIHGVDSLRLLQEIDKTAKKSNRVVDCLLQFHIAQEETKFGLDTGEALALLNSDSYSGMNNVRICGVMGMASYIDDKQKVIAEFQKLKEYFETLKSVFFRNVASFNELSMGMSGDYDLAIRAGATMVRLGTVIFGERT